MRSQPLSGRGHSELLIRVATSGRSVVIMRVCLRLVVLPFLFLAAILVRVRDAGVIVVVLVVARLVLELGDRTTDVVMRHVPVVVAMDFAWMLVLVFCVARDVLSNASGHEYLLSGAPAGALRLADVGSRCFALGRRRSSRRTRRPTCSCSSVASLAGRSCLQYLQERRLHITFRRVRGARSSEG